MGLWNCFHHKTNHHEHDWYVEYGKSICRICGEIRDACPSCGSGEQTLLGEDNYGACDYDSSGRGVEDFVVSVYRCNNCKNIFTATRGSVCGDDSEMIQSTLDRYSQP